MAEEFVSKIEFDLLKDEVAELKKGNIENQKLLQTIDKKIDLIGGNIGNSDKVYELKYNEQQKRIEKLEGSQDWLKKTIAGTIIGIVIKIIFDVSKLL